MSALADAETPVDDTVDVDAMMQAAMTETDDDAAADDSAATPDDEPTEAAVGEADAPAGEVAPPHETTPTYEPFTFKAFKQDYEVPGARFNRTTGTIEFQDERALLRMRQVLSQGREWEATGREDLAKARRELDTLRDQPHAEIEQAKVYLEEFQRLMELPVEDLAQWLMDARTQWPVMQAKAERAYAERLVQHAQAQHQAPEPDVDRVVEQAQSGAVELVQQMLQDQPWATPDIAQEIAEYLHDPRVMDQWVLRAKRDLPEHGVRAGQYVADWDTARALADRMVNPYRRAHAHSATVTQHAAQNTKIAQQNAASLAQAKPKARPAVPVAAASASKPAASRTSSRAALMQEVWDVWKDTQRQR